MFETTKELSQKSMHYKYQETATNIPVQRADVNKRSQKLTTALD